MMKKYSLALAAIAFLAATSAPPASAATITLYDSIPDPHPPNLPSLGYQATSTQEFGNAITLLSGGLFDLTVTVAMSNWAIESTYQTVGTSAGFTVPLTFSLYNDPGDGSAVSSPFATTTVSAFIPWRPESTGDGCGSGYLGADSICYNGSLSTVDFLFPGVTLPSQLIYGLAFNTETHGYNPIGAPGPYNSLNFALNDVPPYVGADTVPTTAYWNTSFAPFYTDGGTGGVGTFRQDTNWTPYDGAVEFKANETAAVPEPASIVLFGIGLVGVVGGRYRQRRKHTTS